MNQSIRPCDCIVVMPGQNFVKLFQTVAAWSFAAVVAAEVAENNGCELQVIETRERLEGSP
ncbi:hypothetical protein AMC83_CH03346 [Rhizobium phaseoli]|uniref:Uncharacterized protein n=1 Tax=Rhizobium phaseoli TaxID=396 RepID=A0A192TE72_9HYPH|nr:MULTISPECIES: hypothetical protein [Rhizobium]MDH6646502.1 hypothetical protein [Rhizobium esperanzae]ANL41741.1 hypothetical protein AMC88_CH03382 [Rhizobium phaseoli]ANL54451.1 hypothetical protein AMC86_CH03342 [Rhizobium phaseoli]ANL60728.1 hypothetical protein AMC85_CH03380 [Rhizobium phaseoli]ANL73294.1 hypothetical protein AMC83_CH03346 [Rhizobium phaseoli]